MPAAARDESAEHRPVADAWWLAARERLAAIERDAPPPRASASFQIGDAVLEVAAYHPAIVERLRQIYGDCALDSAPALEAPIRCEIRRHGNPPLTLVAFQGRNLPDLAAAAYNLLRPTEAVPPYSVSDSPLPGWRLAGGTVEPVLAACGSQALINPLRVPLDFLVDYLVSVALAAQPALLPVHGASVCLYDMGVLLLGASHSGKTTTSLHLAARGHTLLGDELALIRLATNEIVPFRRTVNLRPGPRAPRLQATVDRPGDYARPGVDERWVGPHRIGKLFPESPAGPARMGAAFFLGGFAARASVTPFRLSLDDGEVIDWLATPEIAYSSWGVVPERRALRVLALRQVLTRIPSWLLRVGPPDETAELIERTMEELAC